LLAVLDCQAPFMVNVAPGVTMPDCDVADADD
jgi:hypothetical protein